MAGLKQKTLRAAVIGCGRIGAFTIHKAGDGLLASAFPINHCAAICATPNVELVAICDTNIESAEKAGKLHRIKNIYTDYEKMITDLSPDIVAIATRTAGRAEIISFAASHGVRGLHIEKPLATNLKDTKKALNAIKKNKVAISYGTVRRYSPAFRQAKNILESGKFGKLKEIIVDIPRSQLMWSHPHCVDVISYFAGGAEVDHVESSFKFDRSDISSSKIDMDPVLDSGLVKFKNGISVIITDTGKENFKIICERGEITIDLVGKYLNTANSEGLIKNVKIKKGPSGRCIAIAELRDYINNGQSASMTTEELLQEQKILLALGMAGVTGKEVKLSEIQDNFTVTGKFGDLYP